MFILKNHQISFSLYLCVCLSLLYKEKWVRNQAPKPKRIQISLIIIIIRHSTLERREGTASQPAAFFSYKKEICVSRSEAKKWQIGGGSGMNE